MEALNKVKAHCENTIVEVENDIRRIGFTRVDSLRLGQQVEAFHIVKLITGEDEEAILKRLGFEVKSES